MNVIVPFVTVEKALADAAQAVEAKLDRLLPEPAGPEARLAEAMRYSIMAGGKRLRPFLVMASAELFGVAQECALRVAAAVECVHTYSLIHDDLPAMDNDDMRRGQPTAHIKFDEATAILAGDALLTIAFEILSHESCHADPRVRLELIRCLAQASGHQGMVGGQMIDLAAATTDMDLAAITRLQNMKTGALICFSAEAGAILGRATPAKRHALKGYAQNLGLAFQIADDLLDVEGDPEAMGKRAGKDAAAGKATFVAALGVERARLQAGLLVDQAIAHLEPFGEQAGLLRAVARFAINRSR